MNRDNWDGIFAAEIMSRSNINDYDSAINLADNFDDDIVFDESGFLLLDPIKAASEELSNWDNDG